MTTETKKPAFTTCADHAGEGAMHSTQFALGRIVATPGAINAIAAATERMPDTCESMMLGPILARHARGDWGCVDPEDAATNDEAVRAGLRILSAFPINPAKPCAGFGDNCLWIITEADRSVTTILLPEEY